MAQQPGSNGGGDSLAQVVVLLGSWSLGDWGAEGVRARHPQDVLRSDIGKRSRGSLPEPMTTVRSRAAAGTSALLWVASPTLISSVPGLGEVVEVDSEVCFSMTKVGRRRETHRGRVSSL